MSSTKRLFRTLFNFFRKLKLKRHLIKPGECLTGKINTIGIAIQNDLSHVGIVFTENEEYRFLHLASDYDLRLDDPESSYYHLRINLSDPLFLSNIKALCRKVIREQPNGMPYGAGNPQAAINQSTGSLCEEVEKKGLTCASFVCAIFDPYAPLVNYDTWEHREEDNCWLEDISNHFLRAGKLDVYQRIIGNLPAFRFKPSEVASSSVFSPPPVKFARAMSLSSFLGKIVR